MMSKGFSGHEIDMDFDREETTTPGAMCWTPCEHIHSTKLNGVCEACRGTGRILTLVGSGRYVLGSEVKEVKRGEAKKPYAVVWVSPLQFYGCENEKEVQQYMDIACNDKPIVLRANHEEVIQRLNNEILRMKNAYDRLLDRDTNNLQRLNKALSELRKRDG